MDNEALMVAYGAQSLVDERGISSVEEALLGTPKLHCWGGLPVSSFPHSCGVGERRLGGGASVPPGPQPAWSPGFQGWWLTAGTAGGTTAKSLLPGAPALRLADSSSPQAFSIISFTDFFFLFFSNWAILTSPGTMCCALKLMALGKDGGWSLGSHLSCPCRGIIFLPQLHSDQASWALVLYWKQPPSRTWVGSKSGADKISG